MLRTTTISMLTAATFLLVLPSRGAAQCECVEHIPFWTVEASGGVALFSSFLDQSVLTGGERRLTGNESPSFELGVGYQADRSTAIRLVFGWTPGELEFRDDTGTGSEALDRDDLGDLNAIRAHVSALKFFGAESNTVAPYAAAGLGGTLFILDEVSGSPVLTSGGDDSQLRVGALAGLGLQIRLSDSFAIRLEGNTFTLGNPFDGRDSFRVDTGQTLDEPSIVRITELGLRLRYAFGGGR